MLVLRKIYSIHIKKLEDVGIVQVLSVYTGHGNQKVCRVNVNKLLIDIDTGEQERAKNVYDTEVKVGLYSSYMVYPTCGISTKKSLIGVVDDARYFAHPDRIDAEILWFSRGYVEYLIPNLLPPRTKIEQLTLTAELSSEAPGVNNEWSSDISFYLNDVCIGTWLSPGDYGDVYGFFTPEWWFQNYAQDIKVQINYS